MLKLNKLIKIKVLHFQKMEIYSNKFKFVTKPKNKQGGSQVWSVRIILDYFSISFVSQ